ncbi:MAG: glycosyltransferase family 39 protein [Candidatus Omnitrophica bacterium]|nr:glycosyltransferase family 39 protein [Candidatus Omnitrophota bacterium]
MNFNKLRNPKVKQAIVCFLIFVTFIIWFLPFLSLTPKNELGDYGGDNLQYMFIAKSVLEGTGFRATNFPNQPPWIRAPLFPLILTPVIYFFGMDAYALHLCMMLISALALAVIYLFFSSFNNSPKALLLTSILGASSLFVYASTRILSEIPFVILLGLSLIFIEKYNQSKKIFDKYFLLTTITLTIAFFIRNIGITLYLAYMIYLLFFGQGNFNLRLRKAGSISVVFFSFALVWLLRNRFLAEKSGYIAGYAAKAIMVKPSDPERGLLSIFGLLSRVLNNITSRYSLRIGQQALGFIWNKTISKLISVTVLAGVLLKIKKKLTATEVFFLVYSLFIVAWSGVDFGRYVVPIQFLSIYYLFFFLESFFNLPRYRKYAKVATFSLLAISLLSNAICTHKNLHRFPINTSKEMDSILTMNRWLAKNNHDKSAIIISRKPCIAHFFTGLKSCSFPYSRDHRLVWNTIKEKGARYILLDNIFSQTKTYLEPALRENRKHLKTVFSVNGSYILEVIEE